MTRHTRVATFTFFIVSGLIATAHAQWPALYFRADPLSLLDLSRPKGGSSFSVSAYSYSAEAYFDGLDLTPHTSKAEIPNVRFRRDEYVFAGTVGLSRQTAVVASLPVSYVKQRLFETGDWGVEKIWLGLTHALDRSHHFSVLLAGAIPVDGPVGSLYFPVSARDRAGLITTQFILNHTPSERSVHVYLRVGAGVYTSKEQYYGRRLYEFPGELHATVALADFIRLGVGAEGRFVVGSPDQRLFVHTLSSHDAFGFGPDVVLRLTPEASLRGTYRHEVFGFFATAGQYWNIAMMLSPGR